MIGTIILFSSRTTTRLHSLDRSEVDPSCSSEMAVTCVKLTKTLNIYLKYTAAPCSSKYGHVFCKLYVFCLYNDCFSHRLIFKVCVMHKMVDHICVYVLLNLLQIHKE